MKAISQLCRLVPIIKKNVGILFLKVHELLYKHQPSSICTINEEIIGRINIAIDFKFEINTNGGRSRYSTNFLDSFWVP
jgi:hypothetical protein